MMWTSSGRGLGKRGLSLVKALGCLAANLYLLQIKGLEYRMTCEVKGERN